MSSKRRCARRTRARNGDRFVQELFEMLRIPSLSGDPAHAGDIRRMAEWLETHMRGLGLDNVQIMPTAGHPVVYGEWLGAGPDKPTVLVYGHYDVVPAAMEDGWESDPFEPVVKDGKIYARGATDDKGTTVHPRQGAGVLPEDQRRRAGQCQVPDRRRRGSLVAQPDALYQGTPGSAQGRRLRDQRHLDAQHRRAGDPAQPARHDLHRGRGARPEGRPAQRLVGRRRPQPGAGACRDLGQALQPRQHHRRAGLLRRCRPADRRKNAP